MKKKKGKRGGGTNKQDMNLNGLMKGEVIFLKSSQCVRRRRKMKKKRKEKKFKTIKKGRA